MILITHPPYNAVGDGQLVFTHVTYPPNTNVFSVSTPIFAPSDVGKYLSVSPTNSYYGWVPWWASGGYAPQITSYVSSTQVTLSEQSNGPPANTNPTQTWPYENFSCYVGWGTDNSAALQAALLAGAGGDVFIPTGVFCLTHASYIVSNTNLRGYGNGSVLLPIGSLHLPSGWTPAASGPFLVNRAYAYNFVTGTPTGYVPQAIATYGDSNINCSNFKVDMRATTLGAGGYSIRFYLLAAGTFSELDFDGNSMAPYEGLNFIACAYVVVDHNVYNNSNAAFNPWCGCYNFTVTNNTITIPYAGQTATSQYGGGPYSGISINVIGTSQTDTQASSNFLIDGNTVYSNGAYLQAYAATPINVFPDGIDCPASNFVIQNNKVICYNKYNNGILWIGGGVGSVISNNTVSNSDAGAWDAVLATGSEASNVASPYSSITTMVGSFDSNLVTINWPGHNYSGVNIGIATTYFNCNGGPTIGNFTANGIYPIVSVTNANSFVINALVTLNATGTVNWGGAYAALFNYPTGVIVSNNTLINCTSPGNALMDGVGIGLKWLNNVATFTAGFTQNHVSFIQWSALPDGYDPGTISGNTGPAGVGAIPSGWKGNNKICWEPYSLNPVIVDDDSSGVTNGAVHFPSGSIGLGTGSSVVNISTGTGAPSFVAVIGSLYINSTGAVGSRLYVSNGNGTWNALAGV
jgi:hypothetical protein